MSTTRDRGITSRDKLRMQRFKFRHSRRFTLRKSGLAQIRSEAALMTIESIELAIQKLEPVKLAEFRSWFAEYDETQWDAQIESDAASGKLDAMAAEALAEYESGKAQEL